jgi:NAD(P)H-hydrate repair Nnr-like enzyme with NAD(P)H-hydrate dehydratase domain
MDRSLRRTVCLRENSRRRSDRRRVLSSPCDYAELRDTLLLPGVVHVAPIGEAAVALWQIAPQTYKNVPSLWADAYPRPLTEGNKYRRGHAVVVGGATMTGASRLAARRGARIGAGLVTMAVPLSAWTIYAAALTSVMVSISREPHEFDALLQDPRCNAVAVGPGAGICEETRHCVLAALAARRAVVIDADAITAFADDPGTLFQAINDPCVLTPHGSEFRRLFDPAGDRLAMLRRAAQQSGAVVLLKGADTAIAGDLPEKLPAALRALRQRRRRFGDDASHASKRHGDD